MISEDAIKQRQVHVCVSLYSEFTRMKTKFGERVATFVCGFKVSDSELSTKI